MKRPLGAGRILANISTLKGFTTKRELAEFFRVGPSAVTDWTNRKGDRIPERRLADASRRHSISWEWLAYGSGHPYEAPAVVNATGIELDPAEMELLTRIKTSPQFKKAVNRLLGLPEEQVKIIGMLVQALGNQETPAPGGSANDGHSAVDAQPQADVSGKKPPATPPYLKWNSRYPLTVNR